MIRVIVTDDSAFMRKLLSDVINSDPELDVVTTARDGQDLLNKIEEFSPDLITLDISMPVMDGITALKKIMAEKPLPVIMISALSDEENTFNCLELGAVDFIPKTSGIISIDMNKKRDIIIEKIKTAMKAKLEQGITEQNTKEFATGSKHSDKVVLIGGSTGGPKAIESILQALPKDFPAPILIVQHIPEEFTLAFAARLNRTAEIQVKEAVNGELIRPGVAYIAPGNFHMLIDKIGHERCIKLTKDDKIHGFRPSIDALFSSAAESYQKDSVGIILTGLGEDGKKGMMDIKAKKGMTIVQDPKTCIVRGMADNIIHAEAAERIIPLNEIAQTIIKILRE
ncbi:chemotaxis response regulator protein-glutamate methylesterase [Candidatus Woesearchaeota archaeon]|nr:chemotaxis response regulator protein-glutamate methylesterase [Candidatus Woesearchaeota archaeon]